MRGNLSGMEEIMPKLQEMVLYYQAADAEAGREREKAVRMMKSVLVRMGVRIKNIGADQVLEKVGYLAGMEGFAPSSEKTQGKLPVLARDVLVMKNFTSGRIDTLLAGLRKAGVPKIELKAIVTPQNADWSFYQLYQELEKEHQSLQDTE